MDTKTLSYNYDEEALGFPAPEVPSVPAPSAPLERVGLALVALGLLSLAVQSAGGLLSGTWPGFFSAIGLPAVGGALVFWAQYAGTPRGIRHDGMWFRGLSSRGAPGWMAGVAMTALYVALYWYPEVLGHSASGEPAGLVRVVDPLARSLTGAPASQWFLYGVLYTLGIAVFGVRMAMKYRHNRYQQVRTLSVACFQTLLAWLLPNLLVRFRQPYMEFNGLWPLKYDYLMPDKVAEFQSAGGLGLALLGWVLASALIATPLLTWFFGKRWYCSWVCGCGGLAETVGAPWRQLASTSTRAWKLERILIHSILALVVLATLVLWAQSYFGWFASFAGSLKQWYGFYIGAVFSGVVGVGFYPLLGNRVWCRFGCPQAAILGIIQRFFSRFRITTNGGQCMSCGNCSTYCEMGIDVRAYAQRNENIVRASCVGCGVCAAVCPRGVLRLENGPHGDRFVGADLPLTALRDSFHSPRVEGYEAWGEPPMKRG